VGAAVKKQIKQHALSRGRSKVSRAIKSLAELSKLGNFPERAKFIGRNQTLRCLLKKEITAMIHEKLKVIENEILLWRG
jgi:hypothetical protein